MHWFKECKMSFMLSAYEGYDYQLEEQESIDIYETYCMGKEL